MTGRIGSVSRLVLICAKAPLETWGDAERGLCEVAYSQSAYADVTIMHQFG